MPDREPNWFGFGSGAPIGRPAPAAAPIKQPMPSTLKPGAVTDFLGSFSGDQTNGQNTTSTPSVPREDENVEPASSAQPAEEPAYAQPSGQDEDEVPSAGNATADAPQLDEPRPVQEPETAPAAESTSSTDGDEPAPATGSVSPLEVNPFDVLSTPPVAASTARPAPSHDDVHPMSGDEPHTCSRESPAHLAPLFSALAVQGVFRGPESLAAHFHDCRAGLLLHLKAESGPAIPWAGRDEEPARAGRRRWSYGPMRILDDTFYDLVKRKRNLLAPELSIPEMPAPQSPGPDKKYIAALETPTAGAKAIALVITALGQLLYANMTVDFNTGSFVAKPEIKGSDTLASFIMGTASIYEVDPCAVALRLAAGASSMQGMLNSIRSGHAADSAKRAFGVHGSSSTSLSA